MTVVEKEIVMPEEHEGELGENYTWREMMKRLPHAGPFLNSKTKAHDLDIFMPIWNLLVSGFYFILETVADQDIEMKSANALENCSIIAGYYGKVEVLDKIISLLYRLTGLSSQLWFTTNVITDLSKNRKAQYSLSQMFKIIQQHGNYLSESWNLIFDAILTLLVFQLLPDQLLYVENVFAVHSPLLGKSHLLETEA
jgi:brefeldin A-resistance guanine nucleotide exchange factor 1